MKCPQDQTFFHGDIQSFSPTVAPSNHSTFGTQPTYMTLDARPHFTQDTRHRTKSEHQVRTPTRGRWSAPGPPKQIDPLYKLLHLENSESHQTSLV